MTCSAALHAPSPYTPRQHGPTTLSGLWCWWLALRRPEPDLHRQPYALNLPPRPMQDGRDCAITTFEY
jgi:hypothetical protein